MEAATPLSTPRLRLPDGWLVLLALLVLAVPTAVTLGQQVWSRESGAHGPIVVFTGAWLIWRQLPQLQQSAEASNPWLVGAGMLLALPLYIFGRAYDFIMLETAGLYGVGLMVFYAFFGFKAILKTWFPLLYLAFLIPPPGWMIDQITAPLKLFVSYIATEGLHAAGLPIYRQGVTLIVGSYQLLVEDACSGMNSINGLVAISLFYIYLLRNASWRYSLLLALLVIPIAVIANIIRIVVLVLLTYYGGDAMAQGFLHFTAGILLFATSLILVFAADSFIAALWNRKKTVRA